MCIAYVWVFVFHHVIECLCHVCVMFVCSHFGLHMYLKLMIISPTICHMFIFAWVLCVISAAMANGSSGGQDVLHVAAGPVVVRGPNEAVSSSSEFTHDAIMLLIEAMAARWDLYGQRERSRLFQSVQQELEGHGYPLPVERIRRKWNNLIVTYKRVKERCRGRGQARTSWEYYEVRSTSRVT